ncbi:kappaPI-actitoxin-Avd3c-like [Lycorma delicatula]|uniref:kappaPI-actitoxin-Avd3c-like n=1 Tax=Lycorma delicatula TaxID=130591 RepID=UPI003F5137B7
MFKKGIPFIFCVLILITEFYSNVETLQYRCKLPMDQGICKAAIPRWYFNGRRCRQFIYGGCRGNENRFVSKAECLQQCIY